eukprot:UN02358
MPVYHSKQNDKKVKTACKAAVLPLNPGSVKGPAEEFKARDAKDLDIIDESINYFRANILFSQFEVEGGADLTLVYLTAWIADCLRKLQKEKTKATALKASYQI